MNTKLLPLLALPLLLGACDHIIVTQLPKTPPAVRIADQDSAWGKRPSYDPSGQYLLVPTLRLVSNFGSDTDAIRHTGTTTLEMLVNRDGSVSDAKVVASSGDNVVDNTALALCRQGHYSLTLSRKDPAPYVVSHIVLSGLVLVASTPSTDYGLSYHELPNYTEQYSSEPPNTVNGFPR